MVRLVRGGRELCVADEQVPSYVDDGWCVIDNRGNKIEYRKPISYDEAIRKIAELNAYINSLQENLDLSNQQIRKLESENKKLKRELKKEA